MINKNLYLFSSIITQQLQRDVLQQQQQQPEDRDELAAQLGASTPTPGNGPVQPVEDDGEGVTQSPQEEMRCASQPAQLL